MRKKYQKKVSSYKEGGQSKQDWISNKISLLVNEGRNQDQAVAIALSMAKDKFQEGGKVSYFDYKKTGDTNISTQDINKINQGTGIQFTPEFSQEYFSTQSAPQQVNTPTNYTRKPITDITMGQFDERKIWNVRPETLVGKKEPKEGEDYYVVPPKKWSDFQKSQEYFDYINQNRQVVDEYAEGGSVIDPPLYDLPENQPTQRSWTWNTNVQNPYIIPKQTFNNLRLPKIGEVETAPAYGSYMVNAPSSPKTTPIKKQMPSPAVKSSPIATTAEPTSTLTPGQIVRQNLPAVVDYTTPEQSLGMNYTQQTPQEYAARLQGAMLTPEGEVMRATAQSLEAQTQAEKDFAAKVTTEETGQNQPFQFYNPYAGFNIPQAAGYLGESIANKDALGIVGSGLKLATGLARNIGMGLGAANRGNQVMKSYAEKQRDVVTGANRAQALKDQGDSYNYLYAQEGGEIVQEQQMEGAQQNPQEQMLMQVAQAIQEGAAPEEVLQQLVQNGIPEEQATQLIEMVMQELQPQMEKGGSFMEDLKGKRIVDYKLDEKTGNYTVTYED